MWVVKVQLTLLTDLTVTVLDLDYSAHQDFKTCISQENDIKPCCVKNE